jgi:antitoxin component of MazEF toxin-antitoxin module
MHKYLTVKSGIFIPGEVLKDVDINGEKIEIELGEKEIYIRSVDKGITEQKMLPFVPEKSMFFSVESFRMFVVHLPISGTQ